MSKKDDVSVTEKTPEQKQAEIDYYCNNNTDPIRVMAEEYIQEVEFDLTPLPRRAANSQRLKP